MSLQDWGALGELVGGVAIIVSLIYVGLQIKHGNQEARATTLQATLDSEMFLQAEAMRYAGLWEKVVTGVHLADGEESRRAILLFNMAMTLNQNRYYQFKTGYLDYPPELDDLVTWPIYAVWRASGGATSRSPEFLKILDSQHERSAVQ
jgi:hypothetical protein